MSAQERTLNGSELSDDNLRAIAVALVPHLNRFGIEERPLDQDEAAKFLNCTVKHVIDLRNAGVIKAHRFEGFKSPYYYPSEINKALRKRS
jgi:hypothetical protein